jgi:transposase
MIERVELRYEELKGILDQTLTRRLTGEEYRKLEAALQTLSCLTQKLQDSQTTLAQLQGMLFGTSSEKTSRVFPPQSQASLGDEPEAVTPKPKRKGHGRKAAEEYRGAVRVRVEHPSLKPGDPCPSCEQGKVYRRDPIVLVRIVGAPPLAATVYEMESLRCNLCLEIFNAPVPEGVSEDKYDPSAASMIALLKYGSGFPFHRLEQLQASLGVPLPASTQWEIVEPAAQLVKPAWGELIREAAQGEVVYNDDTKARVLELLPEADRAGPPADEISPDEDSAQRTGVFTSGIVSTRQGRKVALFFTGRQHAGENLGDVLKQRPADVGPPIQMCDALSRNVSPEFKVILGNCTCHGRRKFVEVASSFPEQCRYVLETLRDVYHHDALAREAGLSPQARLAFHQAESGPLMEKLHQWFKAQFAERLVEPNSTLGKAIAYMTRHWPELTLFLRVAGAPLDNNICERALKRVILHRKNSLFYKTLNGAEVGDIFMSLIHTCRLGGVDPLDYLTELQKHADELATAPQHWMPWNYRETFQSLSLNSNSDAA